MALRTPAFRRPGRNQPVGYRRNLEMDQEPVNATLRARIHPKLPAIPGLVAARSRFSGRQRPSGERTSRVTAQPAGQASQESSRSTLSRSRSIANGLRI